MSSNCLPGTPCYQSNDVVVYTTYPKGCESCVAYPISSTNIVYLGPNLPYTGIQTNDTLTEALQKIDALFAP